MHPEPKLAYAPATRALVDSDIRQLASIAANLPPLMGRTLSPPVAAAPAQEEDKQPSPLAG